MSTQTYTPNAKDAVQQLQCAGAQETGSPAPASEWLVDGRPVVRCAACNLVQFETVDGNCRRLSCRKPLHPAPDPEPAPEAKQTEAVLLSVTNPLPPCVCFDDAVGECLRLIREAMDLSQRDLAIIMSAPRTYVSKIENRKATPTLESLKRFLSALGFPLLSFIRMVETMTEARARARAN